jgi:hypothetical protein
LRRQVDSGDLDAFSGEADRVVTWPGPQVDQGAASLVLEALKEAIPEAGATLTEPPLLTLRSLSVVESDKLLFERWMGHDSSTNLHAHNKMRIWCRRNGTDYDENLE